MYVPAWGCLRYRSWLCCLCNGVSIHTLIMTSTRSSHFKHSSKACSSRSTAAAAERPTQQQRSSHSSSGVCRKARGTNYYLGTTYLLLTYLLYDLSYHVCVCVGTFTNYLAYLLLVGASFTDSWANRCGTNSDVGLLIPRSAALSAVCCQSRFLGIHRYLRINYRQLKTICIKSWYICLIDN